jgi:hypothetical protein
LSQKNLHSGYSDNSISTIAMSTPQGSRFLACLRPGRKPKKCTKREREADIRASEANRRAREAIKLSQLSSLTVEQLIARQEKELEIKRAAMSLAFKEYVVTPEMQKQWRAAVLTNYAVDDGHWSHLKYAS